jgi:hypothetical protein
MTAATATTSTTIVDNDDKSDSNDNSHNRTTLMTSSTTFDDGSNCTRQSTTKIDVDTTIRRRGNEQQWQLDLCMSETCLEGGRELHNNNLLKIGKAKDDDERRRELHATQQSNY